MCFSRAITLLSFLLLQLCLIGQTGDCIYATVYGMRNDKPLLTEVDFSIQGEGDNYLVVNHFKSSSGERFKDVFKILGIRYKGEYFFHLD